MKEKHGKQYAQCYLCNKIIKDGKYGTGRETGLKFCYDCAAVLDRKDMQETGKAVLYLSYTDYEIKSHYADTTLKPLLNGKVTNWPGTLSYSVHCIRMGKHNIAKVRYDFWFLDEDNNQWHGVVYGNNTQIAHCKRMKKNW